MDARDRRFTSNLLLVSGPALVLGGFFATFTIEGALIIYAGLGMLVAGVLLRTVVPILLAAAIGALVCASLFVLMLRELP